MTDLLARALLTRACTIRPANGGEWEYALWAIGTGILHARPSLPRG